MNTGGPAFPGTLLDWFAGQALQGRAHRFDNPHERRDLLAQDCYDIASSMLAEKARREATGKQDLQVPDHSGDATKMVWKQSQNMRCAVVCETQFSTTNADDENVEAYGGYLVAESVPLEAMDLIIRAPKLEAQNRELVEALEVLLCASEDVQKKGYAFAQLDGCVVLARAALAKAKEAKP